MGRTLQNSWKNLALCKLGLAFVCRCEAGKWLRPLPSADEGHIDENENGELVALHWREEIEVLGETVVRLPRSAPQISHRLTSDRNRDSAVRGQRLTMARPRGEELT